LTTNRIAIAIDGKSIRRSFGACLASAVSSAERGKRHDVLGQRVLSQPTAFFAQVAVKDTK